MSRFPAFPGFAAFVIALVAVTATSRAGKDDFGGGSIVFARDHSLWKTDPKGKGPAVELVGLPGAASDVRMIRTDPKGAIVLFDLGGAWWWTAIDPAASAPATPTRLPCGAGAARLSADGRMVLCTGDGGKALLISLVTGKRSLQPIPADSARVVVGSARALIWADRDGVWRGTLGKLEDRRKIAPEAPLRGFLAAPDGSRGAAVYRGHVYEKKEKVPADVLDGFALDGKAARRMLHRDATVIDWSWDSTWLLVQVGDDACITRAVGGEYKCWTGYTAVSLAPDGKWAVLLGARKGDATPEDGAGDRSDPKDEDSEGDAPDDSEVEAPSTAPPAARSVYRAKLDGAHTEKPSLVETVVDGTGALWLPGPVSVESPE